MQVELVREPVEALAAPWDELFAVDPQSTPFMAHGWVRAWWTHWSRGAAPWTLVVRDAGAIVALAPFDLQRRGPLRVLQPLGRHPGDYWDVLARPEARAEALVAIGAELARRARDWDALVLNGLPPGSGTDAVLCAAIPRALHRPASPCPAISLPESLDAYLAALPSQRRQNLRRHLRRVDDGDVQLAEVREPDALRAAVARWHELRVEQWDTAGKDLEPAQREPRFRDFLCDVALALVPTGNALVWEFRRAGEVVGVYVNFVDSRSFYWYLGGFDPVVTALGLGKIAVGTGIRQSIEAGRERFDFTHGAEPYKYWYGAEDRLSPSVVLGSGRARSRGALGAAAALSALRDRGSE